MHLFVPLAFLMFWALSQAAGPVPRAAARPSAVIDIGMVIGTTTSVPSATATVNKYLGIPFAQPPLGNLRFQPPKPAGKLSAPRDASQFSPSCIQQFSYGQAVKNYIIALEEASNGGKLGPASEDCLYLNVFSPATTTVGKSVLFWIYGGDLAFGDASIPYYDGSSIAANQDVVVVSINYRVNVFGFSSSPEIATTSQNAGFLDQRLALDWVQRNIAAFGGDPNKITIFGESSGASSVDRLVTTELSNPPFRAAILQSGQATVSFSSANFGPSSWSSLVSNLSCSSASSQLACVQSKDALTIKNIIEQQSLAFTPTVDGVTTKAPPLVAARLAGQAAQVPVLIGSNGQEVQGAVGLFVNGTTFNDSAANAFLQSLVPGSTVLKPFIDAAYASAGKGTLALTDALLAIATDLLFTCPAKIVAKTSAAKLPTWRYYYNATFANLQPAINGLPSLGAYHSSEIPLVFGTYPKTGATAQEIALSKYMQTAWANFAKTPTSGPGWTAVSTLADNDLGCLGCNGDAGVQIIPESKVDGSCTVLNPLYEGTVPVF